MALGIRGANPIWSEVDLQGKLFDDTFYMFVLENTIPYIPATVYHDPDLNVPWTQPIRFLGNGTLPIDIYYEENKVYRLEFRQGPTQQDPLIYEVDNYVPGTGGATPVDTVAFASENEVTNPQFALFSLQSPTTITGTNPDPIEVAPGWFLVLAGTGTVTINQVPLNNSNINPSNAPYALRLTMNGWTDGSVKLQQRFFQNGMLWANKIVSTAITAFINGAPQSISANLIDSNSSVLGTVLPLTTVNEAWNEYTGHAQLPATTNPNVPPAAYIEYQLLLPSNIDIYLTSIQLVVQDLPLEPSFQQDSINRQIDHSYNRAYPIVPIGAIIDFGGIVIPQHYYKCDGAAKNRIRDYLLFSALTSVQTVTLTSGLNTFTATFDLGDAYIGMAIESPGIPAATTITNVVGTTVTMSANATVTGPNTMRFFQWGAGDGTLTFNVPNLQGFVTAGANGTLVSGNVNGVGLSTGAATYTLTVNNLPAHHHTAVNGSFVTDGPNDNSVFGGGGLGHRQAQTSDTGQSVAFSLVQPTKLTKKCIRYQ
jgi:hypothetical protein